MMTETFVPMEVQLTTRSRINSVDFNDLKFGRIFSDHMLVAEYKDNQWASCKVMPFEDLSLSPALSALHYGQSIFEGLKAYRSDSGEILLFRPDQNFKRMNTSAIRMCMPSVPEEIFMGGLKQLVNIDKNWVPSQKGSSLYIRPFMFASDEFLGIRPSNEYVFIIFTCPVSSYYSEPVKVKIETNYTRATPGGIGAAKTAGNYAASLYPARLAQQQGYHQLVWTDGVEHKYIEESGTMNIMFRTGNTIFTPALGDTILPGITRNSVITLAKDWGYEVQERKISVEEVIEGIEKGSIEEVFGVGTAATIAHIVQVGFQDKDYYLPAIEGWEFSNRVLRTLDDLKYGRISDKFGWMTKI